MRDARIAMIYEGTNGVQAMDLVGRKLARNGGRAIQAFFKLVGEEVALGKTVDPVAPIAEALEKANQQLQAATMWLMQNAMTNPNKRRGRRLCLYAHHGHRLDRAHVAQDGCARRRPASSRGRAMPII